MRYACVAAACLIVISARAAQSQTVAISTEPSTAVVLTLSDANVWTPLGTGTAKFKIRKEGSNRVWIVAEGYDTLVSDFEPGKKYPKEGILLKLTRRLVKVTAEPYDAKIYVNGEYKGTRAFSVAVPRDVPVTVEIRKPGMKTESRTYRFDASSMPPISEKFDLKDRMVHVETVPQGGTIKVDGNPISTSGVADVIVPLDKCVQVVAEAEGWAPSNPPTRYCNRDGSPTPKLDDVITLRQRMVTVSASPANANIHLNERQVAQGTYNVLVPIGSCATVKVALPSYASARRRYCDGDVLPPNESIELAFDSAYTSSVASDQANVNFTIEVAPNKSQESAWSTISQVILSKFDVLEITDKETGYMRTAWEVTKFQHSVVRTRVIVKIGSNAPLKYVVKVASEYSDDDGVTVKDDEKFAEWDRLLNSYKDIINELQARLR